MDGLLRLKGIQSLKFLPLQTQSTNVAYHELVDKNLTTLKTLISPPEIFFKLLLQDDAYLDLNSLEIDIRAFRSMCYGIRDGEDVYFFEVKEEFENIIEKKLKIKILPFMGIIGLFIPPY